MVIRFSIKYENSFGAYTHDKPLSNADTKGEHVKSYWKIKKT